jgi:hypothetical protein
MVLTALEVIGFIATSLRDLDKKALLWTMNLLHVTVLGEAKTRQGYTLACAEN